MKTALAKLTLGLAFTLLSAVPGRADYQTTFQTPPYVLDSSVLGIDGWINSKGGSSASVHAKVVDAPWEAEPGARVLRLWRDTTNGDQIRLMNHLSEPLEGEVRVTIGMAFDVTGTGGEGHFAFRDLSQARSPITIGFSNATSGGLFYRVNTDPSSPLETELLLPRDEVKLNSVYIFTLSIHLEEKRFDLSVSGLKQDGSVFSQTLSNLASGAFSQDELTMLYLGGGSSANLKSYVSFIDVRAIPEPGSMVLLLSGGVIGLLFASARCRR